LKRPIAAGLALLVAAPLVVAQAPQQPAPGGQQPQFALLTPAEAEARPEDSSSLDPSGQGGGQAGSAQSSPATQQPAKPVGTAAAPLETATGVTASRPAGAVIAPAKQHRARAILIRVGAVLGAAIAIGAVVGLSEQSSSRPK